MPDLFYAQPVPSRGVLRLTGDDRVSFLQGLISNDVLRVSETHGIWAALLTPQGKFLHDFFVSALGDALLIDGEGPRIADLQRRLSIFKLRSKVKIENVSDEFGVWQGWGETAGSAFDLAAPGDAARGGESVVLLDPRLAELGVRVIAPKAAGAIVLAEAGFSAADWSAWDRLRLSVGVPDGSRDMELEKAILLENGFDELAGVAWDKGCYMGQELTARTKYRGLVKKRLVPVTFAGAPPASGTIVTRPDGTEAGEIRSGQDGLALGLIRLDALTLPLSAGETKVTPAKPAWAAF